MHAALARETPARYVIIPSIILILIIWDFCGVEKEARIQRGEMVARPLPLPPRQASPNSNSDQTLNRTQTPLAWLIKSPHAWPRNQQ